MLIIKIANSIKAITSWLGLMNKPLYQGSFATGTLTITNLSKYSVFYIVTSYSVGFAFVYDVSNFLYSGMEKYSNDFISTYITGTINGDSLTIGNNAYVIHNTSSNHGGLGADTIVSIIGVIPKWGGVS